MNRTDSMFLPNFCTYLIEDIISSSIRIHEFCHIPLINKIYCCDELVCVIELTYNLFMTKLSDLNF